MLLEIEDQTAQNTPTFFDYEEKVDKLTRENTTLNMRLKEMENEMLKAKIESLETQLKGNSVFFEERQKEWDETMVTMRNLSASYEGALRKLVGFTKLQKEVEHIRKAYNDDLLEQILWKEIGGGQARPQKTQFTLNFSEPITRLCEKLELERKNKKTITFTYRGSPTNRENTLHCSDVKIKEKYIFDYPQQARYYICSILNVEVCYSDSRGFEEGISIPVTSDTKKLMEYLGIFKEGCISSTFEIYGTDIKGYYEKVRQALIPFIKLQHGY
jgi:hypothetical protein